MKIGESINQQQAEKVVEEHKDQINLHWRSLVGKLTDLRRQYSGELLNFGILAGSVYIKSAYVAARNYGCNIEEAQVFTSKLL